MRARTVALIGLLSTAAACSPTSESTSWSAHRERAATLRVLYLGFEPALRARTGAGPRCADGSDPGGLLGELKVVVDRSDALRERWLTLASQPEDPARPASTDAVREVRRILDRVDRTLQAGAADPDSTTAILDEVGDDLDAAAALLDRPTERTM